MRISFRQQKVVAEALRIQQVAGLLGVSSGRVRQRKRDCTDLAIRGRGRGLRFSTFQLTDRGELPGWDVVCPALPDD